MLAVLCTENMVNGLIFRTLYSILFCHIDCILCNCFLKYLVKWQTVQTLIRLHLFAYAILSDTYLTGSKLTAFQFLFLPYFLFIFQCSPFLYLQTKKGTSFNIKYWLMQLPEIIRFLIVRA